MVELAHCSKGGQGEGEAAVIATNQEVSPDPQAPRHFSHRMWKMTLKVKHFLKHENR